MSQAGEISPDDLCAAGLDLLARGLVSKARMLGRQVVARDPALTQGWRLVAEGARAAGALDEAREAAGRWQALAPEDGEAAAVLAALSGEAPAPDYPGLQPVPFLLLDDFLPAGRKAEAVDWLMENVADLVEASVLKGDGVRKLDAEARSARVGFEPEPIRQWFQPMIVDLLDRCFRAFAIPRFEPDRYELQLTASYHGDFYMAHRDFAPEHQNQIQTRRITYVYYFQPPDGSFEEGDLRLYDWQGPAGQATRQRYTTILPIDNRLVLFPSHALHEVCKVKAPSGRLEDGRFTLNGWVHCSAVAMPEQQSDKQPGEQSGEQSEGAQEAS